MILLLLLVLAAPTWGQCADTTGAVEAYGVVSARDICRASIEWPTPTAYLRADSIRAITTAWREVACADGWQRCWDSSTEWVTVRVDSMNLGEGADTGCTHDWVNSKSGTWADAAIDTLGLWNTGYRGGWDNPSAILRERICRSCLRREWQDRRPVPPPKREFEELQERLRR